MNAGLEGLFTKGKFWIFSEIFVIFLYFSSVDATQHI